MDLVGSVDDSDVVIVDDMIDTAGTLGKAADVLVANGGKRMRACRLLCSACKGLVKATPPSISRLA